MKAMKSLLIGAFSLCLYLSDFAHADGWSGFYEKATLVERRNTTVPDIEAIFMKDIADKLTEEKLRKLVGTRIEFPLEYEDHPMNFYASNGVVHFPVSSIQFLRDITLAYSWLSVNGYNLQPVSDYLVMIRYQWPRLRETTHTPLELLGVPSNAADDQRVANRFQQLFSSMIVFLQGHELGHIYYRHQDHKPENEIESDRFGLLLVNDFGAVPVGVGLLFHIMSHLDRFPIEKTSTDSDTKKTHPLSQDRLQAVINDIQRNSRLHAMRQNGAETSAELTHLTEELSKVQRLLSDPEVQLALRQIGMTTTPNKLRPRRLNASTAVKASHNVQPQ